MKRPDVRDLLVYENRLWSAGFCRIAGLDEAGRGPLAGPVVSASVVFEPGFFIEGVYDSKALSAKKRAALFDLISAQALAFSVGVVDAATIDSINIYQAARLSMKKAVDGLSLCPDYLLIDALKIDSKLPQEGIIKGDQKSFTIAAASIIAKETRDRMMLELDAQYPEYGFKDHKGYPTAKHKAALREFGPTPFHRRSFNWE